MRYIADWQGEVTTYTVTTSTSSSGVVNWDQSNEIQRPNTYEWTMDPPWYKFEQVPITEESKRMADGWDSDENKESA